MPGSGGAGRPLARGPPGQGPERNAEGNADPEPGVGRVEVALAEAEGRLRVDVQDNGPGVSVEDRELIFDKFRRAGDAAAERPQGTGLGLHISRHIVEHFGGRIWVMSAPGRGACFSFTLPLAGARTAQKAAA